MTVRLGNHSKIHVDGELRAATKHFYESILGAKELPGPGERVAIYELPDGFVAGVFFLDAKDVLTPEQHAKATWLEIKTPDVEALKAKILGSGLREFPTGDATRFFFQAPGGQVFRVAPLDGGV